MLMEFNPVTHNIRASVINNSLSALFILERILIRVILLTATLTGRKSSKAGHTDAGRNQRPRLLAGLTPVYTSPVVDAAKPASDGIPSGWTEGRVHTADTAEPFRQQPRLSPSGIQRHFRHDPYRLIFRFLHYLLQQHAH